LSPMKVGKEDPEEHKDNSTKKGKRATVELPKSPIPKEVLKEVKIEEKKESSEMSSVQMNMDYYN